MSPVPLSRGDAGAWNSIESGQPLVCILEQTGGTGERRGTPAMHRHEAREKFVQSKTLFAQKRYPEALIVLDGLNAAFPNEKHIMLARAMCLAELQRPLEAIQICEQAVALHNDPKSQELLVRLRREHGPFRRALRIWPVCSGVARGAAFPALRPVTAGSRAFRTFRPCRTCRCTAPRPALPENAFTSCWGPWRLSWRCCLSDFLWSFR